jgi:hypothetical protein
MNDMNFSKSDTSFTFFFLSILSAFFLLFEGCVGREVAPKDPDNLCKIFFENRQWYLDADKASRKWGIPIPVLMAIMYQESKYEADARPPRTTCLFIFPGGRPSSAYGFSQAIDGTWKKYIRETDNRGADRDDFGDAIDFIGWYCYRSHKRCKISVKDTYSLYLAYHEGQGGFLKKTYRNKKYLKKIALRVKNKAGIYASQLTACRKKLKDAGGCCLWPV